MKTVNIICDFCEKEIRDHVLYGSLILPGLPETNFCGYCCFWDWIKKSLEQK